jgi:hypothetical protein
MFWLFFSIAVGFCFLAGLFDDIESERGIKAGIAIEDFQWLIGPKPSFRAYFLRDSLLLALVITPSLVLHFVHNEPIALAALVGPVVYGIKHILGGRAWLPLLAAKK